MKRKRKYWKAEEIAWLVKRYPDERAADIAEALDRPLTSIYDKAAQLGLSKSAAFMVSDRSGRIPQASAEALFRLRENIRRCKAL